MKNKLIELNKNIKKYKKGTSKYRNAVSRYLTLYLFLYCNQYSLDTQRERRMVAIKIAKGLNNL